MSGAETILLLTAVYVLCGLVFAALFAVWGVGRLDHGARGASLGFHFIIVPGSMALWPLLAIRWARSGGQGERT